MRLRVTNLYLEVILRRGIHLLELLFGSASDKASIRGELTVCPRPMMALPASENVRAKGEWTTCTVDIPDQPCVGKKSSRSHTRRGLRSRSIPFYTSKDESLRDLQNGGHLPSLCAYGFGCPGGTYGCCASYGLLVGSYLCMAMDSTRDKGRLPTDCRIADE